MNEENQVIGNIEAALAAGKALGHPIEAKSEETVLIIPEGYKAEAFEKIIEPYLAQPRRVKQNVTLADTDSFILYVDAFKLPNTQIFSMVPQGNGAPSFLAVIDYHNPDGDTVAEWCGHRATLQCYFSEEWKRWMANDKKRMEQLAFATFLEENQSIITEPSGADLLELVASFEGHNNISVSSAVKLNNGKVKLAYEEEVVLKGGVSNQSGELEFPQRIVATIELFQGGPAYKVSSRLRYRIENRKVTFWYESIDVHLIIKDAVDGVVDRISEKLKIEPLSGLPQ